MHQYDKVLSYIDYFSTAGEKAGTWVSKPHVFPFVNYSPEMISFIDEVYKTDLIDIEYLSYLESHIPKESNLSDYIENADFRLLRAILTYYVRQERFYDGLFQGAVIDKTIYRILLKLNDAKTPKWAKDEYDCET
ncbi:MAG: DUF6508 domain-containing protein [Candidatus Cloacimonetes bacterium]|jgi:hypothetical protein|nr:DUF6508 domain-containing protein [Candidatus Cloacimonadota bacterium]